MSAQLALISLYLRLVQKPQLARAKDPTAVRESFERLAARWFRTPPDANIIEDRIDGQAGPIMVDWISRGRPDRRAVVIYFHGGAYVMGSRGTHRHVGAHLAGFSGARVALPEYRLGPEAPFPAAVDDAMSVYRSVLEAGYDPARIAFAGDSAGGGLAFSLMLRARDEGLPDPACIAAFSPWIDMTMTQGSLRRNARSDPLLPASRFSDVRDFYLGDGDPNSPYASPLLGDLSNPPPVLIQASRTEILADEAEAMAEKWREAGGDARLEWWRSAPHAWHIFAGMAPEALTALGRAGRFLQNHLETVATADDPPPAADKDAAAGDV